MGIDPRPFTFHQLVLMRTAYENEQWDRLSYTLAVQMSAKGVKNVTSEQFHKFKATIKPQMTTDALRSLKGHFKD